MKKTIALLLTFFLAACGGSHSHDDSSFEGTWDNSFKIIRTDDVTTCNWLSTDEITGFSDTEEISTEDGITYEVASFSEYLNGTAVIDENGNLQSNYSFSGDVFEDGTYCNVSFSLSFTPVRNGKSNTQLYQVVNCNDGYNCEERAVGVATKRIE